MEAGAKMALVTHSRDGQNVKELTIVKGEYLEVSICRISKGFPF